MPAPKSELSRPQLIRYWFENLFLRGLIELARLMPYRFRIPFMGWLVSTLSPLAGYHKRIRQNLELTCPDLEEAEIRRLLRDVPNNAGRTLMEIYSGTPFVEIAKQSPITGPGLAALEKAREESRPVILVTAHFGNYDAARAALIARGYNMGALYRRMANPYFNDHYVRSISAIGTPMFEQGRRGMVEMVRHLKSGGILAILTDLHMTKGERLSFFGQPALTSLVTAELALKFDALLLPVYSIRQPDGMSFTVEVHEPIEHSNPAAMTQATNDDLEALVRKHMGQWFWIHRRWKAANKP